MSLANLLRSLPEKEISSGPAEPVEQRTFCEPGDAKVPPFSFIQEGFTAELYATAPGFMGGVAFAPNGDVLVDDCGCGGPLRRFDAGSTVPLHGSQVHPLIAVEPSGAGCGLTNHPDGSLYTNGCAGVVNLDAETGGVLR